MADAERHTEWGEKVQIKYEVEHFQKYVNNQQKKNRTTQPATHPNQ